MYIEHLDGRFAGQMRDIETSAALELIKVGRARRPNFDAPAPEAPKVVVKAPTVETSSTVEKAKKRR
jgi:hypothetical protein